MMPMALAWCFVCSLLTSGLDFLQTFIIDPQLYSINGNYHSIIGLDDKNLTQINDESTILNRQQNDTIVPYKNILLTSFELLGQVMAKLLIYLAINLVCLYTKYLIDLSQRNAFLETRRSIETRAKIQRENNKQESLLLSLLPSFVAFEIIADIAKEENHDKLLRDQFHKIYIHDYSDVR